MLLIKIQEWYNKFMAEGTGSPDISELSPSDAATTKLSASEKLQYPDKTDAAVKRAVEVKATKEEPFSPRSEDAPEKVPLVAEQGNIRVVEDTTEEVVENRAKKEQERLEANEDRAEETRIREEENLRNITAEIKAISDEYVVALRAEALTLLRDGKVEKTGLLGRGSGRRGIWFHDR